MHVTEDETQIGTYAGLLAASFSLAQLLTSMLWGAASDRFGRKPILIIGLSGNIITMILFGVSKTYWFAIVTRFMSGALNGNIGVAKSVIAEITDDTNLDLAFGIFNMAWSLGAIFGPLIGGYLNNPLTQFPTAFAGWTLFETYPYLLPPLVSAFVCMCGVITFVFWFPEVRKKRGTFQTFETVDANESIAQSSLFPPHNQNIRESRGGSVRSRFVESISQVDLPGHQSQNIALSRTASISNYRQLNRSIRSRFSRSEMQSITGTHVKSSWTILYNKTTLLSISCYTLIAFGCIIIDEVYNLWSIEPPNRGGLGFGTEQIGISLAATGLIELMFQVFFYVPMAKMFGAVRLFRYSSVVVIPILIATPFISQLADTQVTERAFDSLDPATKTYIWILIMSSIAIRAVGQLCCYSAIMVIINNSVTQKSSLGLVNGASQSSAALARTIGPALSGILWSWSISNGFTHAPLDYHFVFFLSAVVFAFVSVLSIVWLPRSLDKKLLRLVADEVHEPLFSAV